MEQCEITEMRSTGPYFSWANKTIWSRIDRSLINGYWHAEFNFTQTRYDAIVLSDHTPLTIQFPISPKPQQSFKCYDMWSSHKDLLPTVAATLPTTSPHKLQFVYAFLAKLRTKLRQFHGDHFHDLQEQQVIARNKLSEVQLAIQNSPADPALLLQE